LRCTIRCFMTSLSFFLSCCCYHLYLFSFPTRRSSDLQGNQEVGLNYSGNPFPFRQDSNFLYFTGITTPGLHLLIDVDEDKEYLVDRKSTRLNSSHVSISYAIFSLKKKNMKITIMHVII